MKANNIASTEEQKYVSFRVSVAIFSIVKNNFQVQEYFEKWKIILF